MIDIIDDLKELSETKIKDFQSNLMPTVDKDDVIGVRTPILRQYAKKMSTEDRDAFITQLPHQYFEENQIHAFIIEQTKDYDECIKRVDAFLPYVNNWATCDQMKCKIFKKHQDALEEKIDEWLSSNSTYTKRFGIEMYMNFFLEEKFKPIHLKKVSRIKSDEYYVEMMIAWYFATALAKQYKATIPYIEQRKLSPSIHKKTIQKAIESNRIDKNIKDYLRSLK